MHLNSIERLNSTASKKNAKTSLNSPALPVLQSMVLQSCKGYPWTIVSPMLPLFEAPAKLSEGKTTYRTADGGLRNAVFRGLPDVNTT
jgi:hypothetical protein